MTDIAILPVASGADLGFDMSMAGADLATDDSLRTAILISFFSDREAEADDVIPDGSGDRRGWWGDAFLPPLPDGTPDLIGSRLWLLSRCVATQANAALAQRYCEEALAWLVADGVAAAVTVTTQWIAADKLAIGVAVARLQAAGAPAAANDNYDFVWDSTLAMAA